VGFFVILVAGCATTNQNGEESVSNSSDFQTQESFALPQQTPPPNDIQSIRLHPKNQPGGPPVIKLDSQEKLVLSFDYLSEQNKQFRIEVSHRTKKWSESPIGPSTYLDSFFQTYIQDSKQSLSRRPTYQHVEYEFPNNQLMPKVSGNYLLEVYSYEGGELLFSMPFFVSEEVGNAQTQIEILFAQRDDGRSLDQLFSSYRYPNFVDFPQFDLSISFVQNQFWGRTREADYLDTSTPGEINGYIDRNDAFISNYEFKALDLRTFDVDGQEIIEFQPGVTPPRIVLRRDVQRLDVDPRFFPGGDFGIPLDDRGSEYAQVEFSLETDSTIPLSSDIYIVGHFNNWMINDLNRMSYNQEEKMWKGRALIKQGEYAYKYVLVQNGIINDLALDQGFLSSQQEYLTFIYFKDPAQNFDRILKVERIIRR
jgi:hypothetical protein